MSGILTALKVKKTQKPGYYGDGNNLYLQVTKSGAKSWLFRYKLEDRNRWMGLGSAKVVTLAEARKEAIKNKKLLMLGLDPITEKRSAKQANRINTAWTFDRCAEVYINAHAPELTPKVLVQWRNTINTYASPVFGDMPVNKVDLDVILDVLTPIWETKSVTASKLRGRIEKILSWAIVKGYRKPPNPAVWRSNLDNLLASPKKIQKKTSKNFESLPYGEINEFVLTLEGREAISAKALTFTILTVLRTAEIIGAQWDEIDLKTKVWTVPAERMKMKSPHRVPLSRQAVALLKSLPRVNEWLFPSKQYGKHIGHHAMLVLLKRMGRTDITVHGFRSTFRTWAAEVSHAPFEIAESALAHSQQNKVVAAYQRGDILEKRRELMQDWADYVYGNNK